MDEDQEHLRLLSIFHYVVGGIVALLSCIPFIHLGVGIAMVLGMFPGKAAPSDIDLLFGAFFIILAGSMILCGWSLAVAIIIAGKYLARRSHRIYCTVVAAIECIFVPFGTVLGVFTILVLNRPSVKALFEASEEASGGS